MERKTSEEFAKIEDAKQQILAQSHINAQELEQKLLIDAGKEFEKARKEWKNKLISEQSTFDLALQNLIAEYFQKFADGALKSMADVSLNGMFLHKLMQKISEQTGEKRAEFKQDFLVCKELELVCAEELSAEDKQGFSDFLKKEFSASDSLKIKFSTDKDLICGVVLKTKEQMIEWNLADYIAEFSKNLNTAISSLINKE